MTGSVRAAIVKSKNAGADFHPLRRCDHLKAYAAL